jgi:hypothetical protein
MELTVTSVDYAPPELDAQVPFHVRLLRSLPGPDRPDYWLGALSRPLVWIDDNIEREVRHLVLCARWQGTQIEPAVENLPVGIAYVVDDTQLTDTAVDFGKCRYVAIGLATGIHGNAAAGDGKIQAGRIAPGFGRGKAD